MLSVPSARLVDGCLAVVAPIAQTTTMSWIVCVEAALD